MIDLSEDMRAAAARRFTSLQQRALEAQAQGRLAEAEALLSDMRAIQQDAAGLRIL